MFHLMNTEAASQIPSYYINSMIFVRQGTDGSSFYYLYKCKMQNVCINVDILYKRK